MSDDDTPVLGIAAAFLLIGVVIGLKACPDPRLPRSLEIGVCRSVTEVDAAKATGWKWDATRECWLPLAGASEGEGGEK
jgi:hypothetical protein